MTQKRRLSIEFEHREVTVTIRHAIDAAAADDGAVAPGDAPKTCGICGCLKLLPLREWMAGYSGSQAGLSLELVTGEFHLAAGGNELWLCERSFEIFKETRR